jgi:hypothetical protein
MKPKDIMDETRAISLKTRNWIKEPHLKEMILLPFTLKSKIIMKAISQKQ